MNEDLSERCVPIEKFMKFCENSIEFEAPAIKTPKGFRKAPKNSPDIISKDWKRLE